MFWIKKVYKYLKSLLKPRKIKKKVTWKKKNLFKHVYRKKNLSKHTCKKTYSDRACSQTKKNPSDENCTTPPPGWLMVDPLLQEVPLHIIVQVCILTCIMIYMFPRPWGYPGWGFFSIMQGWPLFQSSRCPTKKKLRILIFVIKVYFALPVLLYR